MLDPTAAPRQISAAASLPRYSDGAGGLPLAVSSFVGRHRDIAEVVSLVSDSRLVTLTGAAGMGKSRLALEVAIQLAPGYPGGAFFVELAPLVDPSHVAPAVASALALPHEPRRPFVETLADYARQRPLLIVVDNCEHLLLPSAALVDQMLGACPELTVLATSQQALGLPDEHVRQLGPLSLPGADVSSAAEASASEAVALFVDRARATRPDFTLDDRTLPAVGEICRRVDGIPLAIELAAAGVSAFSVNELARRLDRRFQLLDRGSRTAPPRHQTLVAAFQWSYELLSVPEATLLRRLSVFAGGGTLEAVEAVCAGGDVARSEVAELLDSLVAKCLVVADSAAPRRRYRMLDTLRTYAGDRLAETDEHGPVHRRLVAWCVAVVEQAWRQLSQGDQGRRRVASEPDQDNVRAALRWALAHESTLALRLAAAMTPLWKGAGHLGEGREWLERALEGGGEGLAALRARALWGVGLLATLQGDMEAARVALRKSLVLAREGGSRRGEVEALNLLGFVAIFTQDPRAALLALEESVAIARDVGDASAVVAPLSLCGRARLFLGEVGAARQIFEECLELAHEAGTTGGDLLIGLGWTMLAQGEHARAEEALAEALHLLRASEDRFELALALSFVAELAWSRNDHDTARAALTEGLAHARSMRAPFPLARCLQTMGRLVHSEGDAESARRWLDEAVDAARQSALPWALVRCLHARSEVAEAVGDLEGAKSLVQEALALARETADKEGCASSLHLLGRLARSSGDLDRAALLHREALAIYGEVGDASGTARCGEALAGALLAHDELVPAARLLGAAGALRDAKGSRRLPSEEPIHRADVERLRARLPAAQLDQAWAEGGSRSVDEVVASVDWTAYRPSQGWSALSQREHEVVDLIARGMTYAEVGERLFISPRTVQGHVSKVFTKLGVSSRRELRELARQSQ